MFVNTAHHTYVATLVVNKYIHLPKLDIVRQSILKLVVRMTMASE